MVGRGNHTQETGDEVNNKSCRSYKEEKSSRSSPSTGNVPRREEPPDSLKETFEDGQSISSHIYTPLQERKSIENCLDYRYNNGEQKDCYAHHEKYLEPGRQETKEKKPIFFHNVTP